MTSATTSHRAPPDRAVIGWLMIVVCAVGATLLSPRPARAQSGEVERLVEEATNHYDQLEIGKAKQKLERAVQVADDRGVSGKPVARAHIMVAVVAYGADKDEGTARSHFEAALKHDPDAEVPDVYKTPTLESLMEEAKESVDASASSDQTGAGGSRRDVDTFTHEPITSAQAGDPLVVEAFVPTDMSVGTVNFYFRRYDQDAWTRIPLEATNATRFAVELAGYRVYTSQIDYYLEAVDPSGEVVASSGDEHSPHSITVLGSASFDPEQAKKEAEARGDQSGDATGGGAGDQGGSKTTSGGPSEVAAGGPSGYIEIGGGTGAGFVPRYGKNDGAPPPTENPQRALNPGLAPAFAHATLGAGAWVGDDSTLGIYMRWQPSPSTDLQSGADAVGVGAYTGFADGPCLGTGLIGDCQIGLKYRWYFTGGSNVDFFSSVGAGAGRVRHWVRLKEQESTDYCQENDKTIHPGQGAEPDYCYRPDTVRPGFLHVGVGGGVAFQFSDTFAMLGEGYLEILFPDPSVNLDVQFGPQFRF